MRIFVLSQSVYNNYIELSEDQFHHLSRVLRIRSGETIEVVVDQEVLLQICFEVFKNKCLYYKLITKELIKSPLVRISLFQGFPKQDKFMSIIDCATQCGVADIIPVITDRSIIKQKDYFSDSKYKRWNKQAELSAMQSKQTLIPKIHPSMTFKNFIDSDIFSSLDQCFVAWEGASQYSFQSFSKEIKKSKSIGIFIGPEGGISDYDIELMSSKGFKIITIGSTIIRVEIAAVVALSQILFLYL